MQIPLKLRVSRAKDGGTASGAGGMLRESVGVIDISNFGKYSVKGAGAEEWLNAVFANRIPSVVGRSCLTPLIGKRGGIAGDATVTKLGEHEYWVVSSGMAERYPQFLSNGGSARGHHVENKTNDTCAFNVRGRNRVIAAAACNADLSNAAWPFMRSGHLTIAGVECAALRVSFTGDLGWEIYCDVDDQLGVYTALIDAAAELGGGPVGSRVS